MQFELFSLKSNFRVCDKKWGQLGRSQQTLNGKRSCIFYIFLPDLRPRRKVGSPVLAHLLCVHCKSTPKIDSTKREQGSFTLLPQRRASSPMIHFKCCNFISLSEAEIEEPNVYRVQGSAIFRNNLQRMPTLRNNQFVGNTQWYISLDFKLSVSEWVSQWVIHLFQIFR